MEKKTMRIIVSVVLALAAFTILSTVISLFFSAFFTKDMINIGEINGNEGKTMNYIRFSSIALACIAAVTLVSYFFTYFTKHKKIFAPIATGLSFLMVIMCISFIFNLRSVILKFEGYSKLTCYSLATEFFAQLITIMVAALIACSYFAVVTALAFKKSKAALSPAVQEENGGSEKPIVKEEVSENEEA